MNALKNVDSNRISRIMVDDIHLIESRLESPGAIYNTLETYKLGGIA